jgi:spore maturation protein CgeB
MRFVLFYHSFSSCWNHGNAHFLRGLARELIARGHEVAIFEPEDGWSITHARHDGGAEVVAEAGGLVPGVELRPYRFADLDLDRALDHADVVIAHEWNPPALIAALGERRRHGRFLLLFHDTHHRAVSAPDEIDRFELDGFDAVLAFGEVLRQVYLARGWGRRAITWHEAADTALFRPLQGIPKQDDLIFIGNWGDGERDAELRRFLIEPAVALALRTRVHGVRYPDEVKAELAARGIRYDGWLPNHRAPAAFAHACMTIHVPRRPYVEMLPGIPTIRVFEALACGIPLVCSTWHDVEGLFGAGHYLSAANGDDMRSAMALLLRDTDLAAEMAATGLATIRSRHSCAVRAGELLTVIAELRSPDRSLPHLSSAISHQAPLS